MNCENKILFICKKRKSYGGGPYTQTVSSGLLNSAKFVNDMLVKNGIESNIVEVIDNNGIDREVHKYKPTHVIIEALWVVPSKFEILTKLHPKVKWIIRLHSDTPFIANEGIAMEWIFEYQKYDNVSIAVNSPRIEKELNALLEKPVIFLPNFYPVDFNSKSSCKSENDDTVINISSFGAIRPLKNQLIQAIAAIKFADEMGKKLKFHINVTRIENYGDPVLKNLKSLFNNTSEHELIEHKWLEHDDFVKLIGSMDICMQVSFSETFNIVTADAVNQNIPVVVSPEIKWILSLFKANPTNSDSIIWKLKLAWYSKLINLQFINKLFLLFYSGSSESTWLDKFAVCECEECECDD